MKIAFGLIGTIFIATATTLYNFNHKASGLICALTGILLFIVLVYIYIKDRNLEKYKMNSQESGGFKVTGVGTDDDTRLVIKAICDESHGFVSFNDIAKDTNLSLKTINKALATDVYRVMPDILLPRTEYADIIRIETTDRIVGIGQIVAEEFIPVER